jgi:acetyltransferase-like isoleucine patch superfamily enzyme
MHGGTVRCELTTHEGGRLEIGHRVFVNYGCSISAHALVSIGDGCLIGQYTIIMDCDYHSLDGADDHGDPQPIAIEDGVWLGARTIVLKGVRIGRGSVIAAGSVVTRDIPPGVVAGGSPAHVIRHLAGTATT